MSQMPDSMTAGSIMFPGAGGDDIQGYLAQADIRRRPGAGWSSSITCPATTGPPRRSPDGSPSSGMTQSARTCTGGTRPARPPMTPRPPRGPAAECPIPAARRCGGRRGIPPVAAHQQRPGRHHRLLLGRPAKCAGRLQSRHRRRGRLLRRLRHQQRTVVLPDRHDEPGRPTAQSPGAPARACSAQEDKNPDPAAVAELTRILGENGKDFTPHSYPDAGHGFFATDRIAYRVAAANDGWERITAFFSTTTEHRQCRCPTNSGS